MSITTDFLDPSAWSLPPADLYLRAVSGAKSPQDGFPESKFTEFVNLTLQLRDAPTGDDENTIFTSLTKIIPESSVPVKLFSKSPKKKDPSPDTVLYTCLQTKGPTATASTLLLLALLARPLPSGQGLGRDGTRATVTPANFNLIVASYPPHVGVLVYLAARSPPVRADDLGAALAPVLATATRRLRVQIIESVAVSSMPALLCAFTELLHTRLQEPELVLEGVSSGVRAGVAAAVAPECTEETVGQYMALFGPTYLLFLPAPLHPAAALLEVTYTRSVDHSRRRRQGQHLAGSLRPAALYYFDDTSECGDPGEMKGQLLEAMKQSVGSVERVENEIERIEKTFDITLGEIQPDLSLSVFLQAAATHPSPAAAAGLAVAVRHGVRLAAGTITSETRRKAVWECLHPSLVAEVASQLDPAHAAGLPALLAAAPTLTAVQQLLASLSYHLDQLPAVLSLPAQCSGGRAPVHTVLLRRGVVAGAEEARKTVEFMHAVNVRMKISKSDLQTLAQVCSDCWDRLRPLVVEMGN